jgi:ethanolamine permease
VAEETIHPQRNVLIGFGSAILTLVVLCVITFIASIGIGGWETVVYPAGSTTPSDSPLPLALIQTVGASSWLYKSVGLIGLCGLIASFNGIILASGRATFEFGRLGDAPTFLGKIHNKFKTPANALVANMAIGIIALLTGKTSEIITISCFGALTLYMISMVALIRLRQFEPMLARPFKVPLYPWFPVIALVISGFAVLAIAVYNVLLAGVYVTLLAGTYTWFRMVYK